MSLTPTIIFVCEHSGAKSAVAASSGRGSKSAIILKEVHHDYFISRRQAHEGFD